MVVCLRFGCISSFVPGFASGGVLFVGCFVFLVHILFFVVVGGCFASSLSVFVFSVVVIFVFLYS